MFVYRIQSHSIILVQYNSSWNAFICESKMEDQENVVVNRGRSVEENSKESGVIEVNSAVDSMHK